MDPFFFNGRKINWVTGKYLTLFLIGGPITGWGPTGRFGDKDTLPPLPSLYRKKVSGQVIPDKLIGIQVTYYEIHIGRCWDMLKLVPNCHQVSYVLFHQLNRQQEKS